MALLFIDGFDKYGPPGQFAPAVASLLTAGEWTSVTGATAIGAGLSAIGYALQFTSSGSVSKTLASSPARLIGGVRFNSNLFNVAFVSPLDSGTSQCTVRINAAGTISILTGAATGTVIATSSATVSANSTHYLEFDLTIGASANYQVWLDGASILSGTGNTRATTNNSANGISLGTSGGTACIFDDFYLFDTTGSTNNAVLLTNPIVETAFPTGDAQTQWSNGATVIGQNNSATGTTNAPGANFLFLRAFTPPVNMTLNSVSCVPKASGAAKFKAVLYGAVPPTGAHRYWRINVLSTSASAGPLLPEIQLREVAGTPETPTGGTASASSTSSSFTPAQAVDGNVATIWQANTSITGWWQYDYGAGVTKTIVEVAILIGAALSGLPLTFELQYSDDNVNFFVAASFAASTWAANTTQVFTVSTRPTVPGSPGSPLIATGTEIVGTTSGATLTAPFASGQALTAGTAYAIGYITDTSVPLQQVDGGTTGVKVANTYTSGAAPVLPTMTTGQPNWQIWGNCTGSAVNWPSLTNNPAIDDLSYAFSSTVSQEDHYAFPALSNTPAAVYAVSYKARAKRSDSGTRTADVRCVSGGANSPGTASGFVPGTTFGWLDTLFETDPNTGVAWTGTGVNAAVAGPKVAS